MMIARSAQVVLLIPALAHFYSHTERYHQHSNDTKAPWHLANRCLTNSHLVNRIVILVFWSTCHLLRKIFSPKSNRSTICFLNIPFGQIVIWLIKHLPNERCGRFTIWPRSIWSSRHLFAFRLSKTSSAEKLVRVSQTMSTAWLQPHLNTDTSGLIL